jgi:uncharacterized metal-binding protein
MPNGKTHDKITFIVAPIISVIAYYFMVDIKNTFILMFAYFFASLMFNGDLDTNSRPYNRWFIFKMIWIPYQLMFKHRSIFSHGLIIGTLIRIIYLSIIPIIIILFKYEFNNIFVFINENTTLLIISIIGLEIGSAIHTISDKVF